MSATAVSPSSALARLRRRSEAFFRGHSSVEGLAREQGARLDVSFDELKGDFWPEGESVDEFIDTVRRWRREGGSA